MQRSPQGSRERSQGPPALIAVLGPTSSGKSSIGIYCASKLGGEIISADAFQVYRGLDIGTGKTLKEERRGIPHHLIDICDIKEQYTAGRFVKEAARIVRDISDRGNIPFMSGGTGFYIRAYLKGLSDIPAIPSEFRSVLQSLDRKSNRKQLYAWLNLLDPDYAASIPAADTQRVERALEIILSTGRSYSSFRRGEMSNPDMKETLKIGLFVPRELLKNRITERVERMFVRGWIQEVDNLISQGYRPQDPGMKAIGYRALADHLAGRCSLEETRDTIIRQTAAYARRQMTWLRKEDGIKWFDTSNPELAKKPILEYIKGKI